MSGATNGAAALLQAGEQLPAYADGSLVSLVSSIAAGADPQAFAAHGAALGSPAAVVAPEHLAQRSRSLLWLIDGLGYERLTAGGGAHAPIMNAHLRGEMTSVFPSATASAITSVMTGLPPVAHGITGWRVRLGGGATTVAPLPFRPDQRPPAGVTTERLRREAFAAAPLAAGLRWPRSSMHILLPDKLVRGEYTTFHSAGASLHGFANLDDGLFKAAALLREPSTRFVYLYWPELDHLAHNHGIYSQRVDTHLKLLDTGFGQLLDLAQGCDANVMMTADHGFVDTREDEWFDIDTMPGVQRCLAHSLTGEPRAAYAHLRPGMRDTFLAEMREALGDQVRIVASDVLLEAGWFGPAAGSGVGHEPEVVRARLGDFTLLPTGRGCLHHNNGRGAPMIGIHGGLLAAEMRIPLVLARP